MGALRRLLVAVWRALDGLRRFLHLVLLLVIFGFVVGALRGSVPSVPSRAALLVAPAGELVEQLSGDPFQRAMEQARGEAHAETLLWDLTDAIRGAAQDRRIQALALDLDKFDHAGQPVLEELARALREFRASGKKIIAYGTELTQERYYLAAQADEVDLDPLGFVLLEGYGRYPMYFRQALEKLSVDVNVFRVGSFKSAVEPFTRSDMSPEDRAESEAYLTALWSRYQEAVTHARKLPADAVRRYSDGFAAAVAAAHGDAAQVALHAGLVTALKTRIDFERRLMDMVGADDTGATFRQVAASDYIRLVRSDRKLRGAGKPHVGVIVASGEILDGDQPPGRVGGESTARLVRQARLDKNIKAVVLRVNSPGGSVLASEQIYREVLALRAAGKPVVVSMSDLAASGGYYISAPADEIIASPATLTGSIGIFAVIPTFDRSLARLGISVDGVGTTPLSGQLRLDRPLGAEARSLAQSAISHGYDEFIARVSNGRHKSTADIERIAQGRVWAGGDARSNGLVDGLGSFDDAVRAAARRAHLTDYHVEFVEPQLSIVQQLVQQFRADAARVLFRPDAGSNALLAAARRFDPVRRELERVARFTDPNRIYAYCFCGYE